MTIEQFYSLIDVDEYDRDACFRWNGNISVRVDGVNISPVSPQRAMWLLSNGAIMNGYIMRECGNTFCVNPRHLIDVTRNEQIQRSLKLPKYP